MRSILGSQAVREMLDDLPAAIGTAIGMAAFIICAFLFLLVIA